MFNLVIARYNEALDWINELPQDCRIHLYNKGAPIPAGTIRRDIQLKNLRNVGRESGTYLHHLMEDFRDTPGEFTVFTQADPFKHSPRFLDLMRVPHRWRDVQPLAHMWLGDKNVPPRHVLEIDRRDWIDDMPVRGERFSLCTWNPVSFFDQGAYNTSLYYRNKHQLPEGFNIAAHFMELGGLLPLAEQAWNADMGVFSYGAIFAVRAERIRAFLDIARPHLEKLELLTRAEPLYGYLFERCWLHFYGESFLRFEAMTPANAANAHVRHPALIPAQPGAARLSPAAAGAPAAPAGAERNPDAMRRRAHASWQRGDVDGAETLLREVAVLAPGRLDVLSDLAALNFQRSRFAPAIEFARAALTVNPRDLASQFTLAMSLARQGCDDEALRYLEGLTEGAEAQRLKKEAPELLPMVFNEAQRLRNGRHYQASVGPA